ncbi:unknown [Ruminococcus sp. CAG:353]|nr:unknown [Ruminococcus sp. CAG:353]
MCDKYNITISLNTKRFYSLSCFILAVEFFAVLKSRAYIYKRSVKLRASVLCVNLDRSKLCIDFFKSFFFGCKLLLLRKYSIGSSFCLLNVCAYSL